jgi:hypothetical protein
VSNTSQLSDALPLDSAASGANQVGTDRLVSERNDSGAEAALFPEERPWHPDSLTPSNEEASEVTIIQTDNVSDGDESHSEEESAEGQKDHAPTTNGVIQPWA